MRGEIDAATAPAMWDTVDEALGKQLRVVLDMGEVEFIDLHGLAVLKRATRRAERDRFAIAHPAPCVIRLLELVHAEREIPILPDETGPPAAA